MGITLSQLNNMCIKSTTNNISDYAIGNAKDVNRVPVLLKLLIRNRNSANHLNSPGYYLNLGVYDVNGKEYNTAFYLSNFISTDKNEYGFYTPSNMYLLFLSDDISDYYSLPLIQNKQFINDPQEFFKFLIGRDEYKEVTNQILRRLRADGVLWETFIVDNNGEHYIYNLAITSLD